VSAYDEIADWYDAWAGSDPPVHDAPFQAVAALMGSVDGLRVCDLACGQGRVSRYLADHGASVVGVDISARLLEIARRHEAEQPRGIDYRLVDATSLDVLADAEFDGVLAFMSLMDMAALEPTLASVYRVLKPAGWFVFAILHPCFHTGRSGELTTSDGLVRTVGQYFVEGFWRSDTRTGPPGKVGAYHRTLSTYLNTLLAHSFRLDRFEEPITSGRQAELRPIWTEVPGSLVVRCVKVPPR